MCNACASLALENVLVEEVAALLRSYCDDDDTSYSIPFLDLAVWLPERTGDRIAYRALRRAGFEPDTETEEEEIWHRSPSGEWKHHHEVNLENQDFDIQIGQAVSHVWGTPI
ncbi:hypothetical protein BMI91_13180 [Thioclava sediminum]|uniref:Uncharacterized protein n=1 Tax=Thioclava sediminum TaxID=1915319 RepID=A0ABX3MUS5_9RHOB|nr:hypothetical protein [Thioclava sediminum]OOY23440.1 hypothetical protein BMI91_13180 [Thioclava sediminum]